MKFKKKLCLATGIVFIALQFIQPVSNKSGQVLTIDISNIIIISGSVHAILKNACYDCHSDNTNYPFYSNIQPIGWIMAKHIMRGKETLNFSEFGSYTPRRQLSKLTGIANSIKHDNMPLSFYKLMHKNSRLSASEKVLLINWAQQSKDSLSVKN